MTGPLLRNLNLTGYMLQGQVITVICLSSDNFFQQPICAAFTRRLATIEQTETRSAEFY
jgi:hypothetical protein